MFFLQTERQNFLICLVSYILEGKLHVSEGKLNVFLQKESYNFLSCLLPHVLEGKLHVFLSKGKLRLFKLLGATCFRRKAICFSFRRKKVQTSEAV